MLQQQLYHPWKPPRVLIPASVHHLCSTAPPPSSPHRACTCSISAATAADRTRHSNVQHRSSAPHLFVHVGNSTATPPLHLQRATSVTSHDHHRFSRNHRSYNLHRELSRNHEPAPVCVNHCRRETASSSLHQIRV